MKKTLLFISLFIGLFANSQVLGYEDIGVLLSNENMQSTARTIAMKGAFGALGGDLSAMAINPASAAVFTNSTASFTLGNNHINLATDFYGNVTQNSFDNFNLSQVGGLLLFENENPLSKFKKVAVSINLNTVNNFNNEWTASGLTTPTWIDNPTDYTVVYTNVESQKYLNVTTGSHKLMNFSFATQYGKNLFFGASLNTYNVEFNENGEREEIANDGVDNSVDAFESFWQEVNGDGVSLSAGVIMKATQNLRLGLSFTSPTWYELSEESNIFAEDEYDFAGYYDIIYSNEVEHYTNNINKVLTYNYKFRSPSKATASIAYVFGAKGLISADLTRKNFNNVRLRPNYEFEFENSNFHDLLTDTYQINLGTEWRFKKISLRGGYSYEQSPYNDSIDTDNKIGYALGLGYDFGSFIIDLAYDYNEQTDYYNFYPEFDSIRGAELTKNNDKIMATLAFKF